ncbi:uncharacterized protein PHACADRAFT_252258 [Phanerochaete carnosa HHB-10118-sp]|uniref:Uncharacterized protein n=1 Tax=Phanerochaete carnosa (strain HHB-10118-sp) TaxID=650164 RepID=K5WFS5_PHACS|nr:uncharacterized protein PHACADRAFT_252258 [Phanerochaete carnosa HHB-10118-sp]EKM58165.1 hypothetical protein PHACADRAFT_252258 [Phanerochaete carnosa HHB-10118-sp]
MAQFVDIGALLGFACEAVLFGINLVVFGLALNVLLPRFRRHGSNQVILALSIMLFLSCVVHFALEFSHFHTTLRTTGVDGFANETNVYFVADLFISITDFFGDLILIYRLWLIWGGNYLVTILPLLTSIAGLICAAEVGHLVNGTHNATPSPSIVPLGLASFSLPFCTNVMVTLLIVGRIWYMSRGMRAYKLTGTRRVMAIMLESGMLYFLVQLVFLTLYGMNNDGEQVIIPMAVQVYGIASFLIVIQAGLGLTSEYLTNAVDNAPPANTWGRLLLSNFYPTHLTSKANPNDIELESQKDSELTTPTPNAAM